MLGKVPLTRIRVSYFLFIALLITVAASARQNAAQMPPQAQQNNTATQARSNTMFLDVVVSQKSGSPVAGLRQQDFTLLDNKSPQAITSFKEIAGRQAPINVVLVIDAVNIDARTIAYEREQIGRFLSSEGGQLAYPTVLSVFTETGIQISGDFTNDGNALKSELDSDKIGLRPVGGAAGFYGATERLQLSLTALRQFTAREGARPGRNVMIWISPGWPILSGPNVELDSKQKQQIFADIVDMSNRLTQARVTLYEVNPLGASESQFRGSYYDVFLKPVTKPDQVNLGNLALQVLSIQSGGRAFDFNNDLPGLLQKCFTDIAPYYEIAFVPAAAERPDEYHSLEVKVSKSGLTAHTRQGYYAQGAQHD
jgi:VWFA-related protein